MIQTSTNYTYDINAPLHQNIILIFKHISALEIIMY